MEILNIVLMGLGVLLALTVIVFTILLSKGQKEEPKDASQVPAVEQIENGDDYVPDNEGPRLQFVIELGQSTPEVQGYYDRLLRSIRSHAGNVRPKSSDDGYEAIIRYSGSDICRVFFEKHVLTAIFTRRPLAFKIKLDGEEAMLNVADLLRQLTK